MKQQGKSSGQGHFSASALSNLQDAYRMMGRTIRRQPWLVQGSVNEVAPTSPSGGVTYTWTRKVCAKTVTVALSKQQAVAFRQAINANREVETALSHLREVSQVALLTDLPSVTKRRLDARNKEKTITVPKGS
jgi:hypothetical protein